LSLQRVADYAGERCEIENRLLSAFVPILNAKKEEIKRLHDESRHDRDSTIDS
jgi:hypothetical protein